MKTAVALGLLPFLMSLTSQLAVLNLQRSYESQDSLELLSGGVEAVLAVVSEPHCSVMFFTDGASTLSTVAKNSLQQYHLWTYLCKSVFEVSEISEDFNVTQTLLYHVVSEAQRLRQVSWCVTLVVVSDNHGFLSAFVKLSLSGRLVVPATKLLVVTDFSKVNDPDLSKMYSRTNSMVLVKEDSRRGNRCGVYTQLPYSPQGSKAVKLASWTPHEGLVLTSHTPLFPDKFSK
nr:uncharacterized protein LOC123752538 [Procambarus clarkii]